MAHDFSSFKKRVAEIHEWLGNEFVAIRTGRATPALLDNVKVESYGTLVLLQQVGSVGVEDARTIRITPWDAGMVKDIEKAVAAADLGVSVGSDEKGVRVTFPELTSERRGQLVKLAKQKHEEARVSIRGARDEAIKDIEKKEKDGEIGKDEKFSAKEALQKEVDTANKALDEMLDRKEKEIAE